MADKLSYVKYIIILQEHFSYGFVRTTILIQGKCLPMIGLAVKSIFNLCKG
jgi:hypothetical protein